MAARRPAKILLISVWVTRTVRLRRIRRKIMYGGPAPGHAWLLHVTGIPRLRRAISRWYQDRYGIGSTRNQKPSSLLVRKRDWRIDAGDAGSW